MIEKELIEKDIAEYLERHYHKELLRFVTVGSVDDGKSTLIGRLLYDTESVYDDQIASVRKAKGSAGGEIDYSLLLDGLKAEREQGITIDVAYRYFSTEKRKFIIADTPGHVQYTRNMATGASTADLALILIDARLGVLPQSKRHAYIASLLGIAHLVVCVNKMDLVDYDEKTFEKIKKEFTGFTKDLGFQDVSFFPVSALKGDNIVAPSPHTPWFKDGTILNHLETVPIPRHLKADEFCFPVQYVVRPHLNFRGYAGTIASGTVKKGDEVVILPSGVKTKVKSIVTYDGEHDRAETPLAVTLTLEDEVDASRGNMITHADNVLHVSRHVQATLVWMSEAPLAVGRQYWLKHTTNLVTATVDRVDHSVDVETLAPKAAETLSLNDLGQVQLKLARPLILDLYRNNRQPGAFILIDRITNATVAAGMISGFESDEQADQRALAAEVSPKERERRFGHKAGVVCLVGLPGSGKVLLARNLERRLFDAGNLGFLVDPEKFPTLGRHGTGHLDAILPLIDGGMNMGGLVITSFTFAEKKTRAVLKKRFGENMLEIYIKATRPLCKERLEHLGRDLSEMEHGFQEPSDPDLVIDTDAGLDGRMTDRILELLDRKGFFVKR